LIPRKGGGTRAHRDAGHALVSLVKVSGEAPYTSFPEIHDAMRRALDLLGGLERVVSPGDTVVIKPNLVRPMRYVKERIPLIVKGGRRLPIRD